MAEKAFNLKEDAFQRIPTSAYAPLEKSFSDSLKSLYKTVGAPVIPPWRKNVASVYLLVAQPVSGNANTARAGVKDVLGAQYSKSVALGSPISILAVPVAGASGKFHKVEVHECQSETEFNCARFYLSYGDLGMIMSLMARVHGFVLGSKGLKTHYGQPDDVRISGYLLSTSPEDIIEFYGLSAEAWKRGFKSQDEMFTWLKQSRFYNAAQLVAADAQSTKKSDPVLREMYHAFITIAASDKQAKRTPDIDATRDEALATFEKEEDYNKLVFKNRLDRARREKYNGVKVMEWTKQSGVIIRDIMNKVREKVGEKGLIEHSEEILKNLTVQVAKETPAATTKPRGKKQL